MFSNKFKIFHRCFSLQICFMILKNLISNLCAQTCNSYTAISIILLSMTSNWIVINMQPMNQRSCVFAFFEVTICLVFILAMKSEDAGIQLSNLKKFLILIHGSSFFYTITEMPYKIELLCLQSHFNQFPSPILLKTLIFTNVRNEFGGLKFCSRSPFTNVFLFFAISWIDILISLSIWKQCWLRNKHVLKHFFPSDTGWPWTSLNLAESMFDHLHHNY